MLTNQDHILEIFQSCLIGDGNNVITKAELTTAMGQPPTYKKLPEMMIEADGLTMRWIGHRRMDGQPQILGFADFVPITELLIGGSIASKVPYAGQWVVDILKGVRDYHA
ncbi:hypothetical protein LINPERPRIM_LOCUS30752 [Linum perenne]